MRGLALALLLAVPGRAGEPALPEDFPSEMRLEADTFRYRLYEVRFPSAERTLYKPNETVWGHLYLPKQWAYQRWRWRDSGPPPTTTARSGGAHRAPPCILVLPVMAAPNVWIELRFVQTLVRAGHAVMWLEMPYQFNRRPFPGAPSGQGFLARTAPRLAANFRHGISDARRAVTWLERSRLVDRERIGVFGISLGALVGSAVLSSDPRPRAGVLALGGADFPSLAVDSEMTGEFIRRAGIRPEELRKAWLGMDPLERREANRGRKVVLINARGDKVIPAQNGLRLKEAFPDARQLWVPGGHISALLHLAWVPTYTAWAFERLLR